MKIKIQNKSYFSITPYPRNIHLNLLCFSISIPFNFMSFTIAGTECGIEDGNKFACETTPLSDILWCNLSQRFSLRYVYLKFVI